VANAVDHTPVPRAPLLLLVHGSLHGSACWARLTPWLVEAGLRVLAIDLPGTGLNARFPVSAFARPFDAAAYASEVSPAAALTLSDYADAVGGWVDRLHAAGQGPIILLGHSLGGLTLNAVGQTHADKLAGLIYLAAVMPGPDQNLVDAMFANPNFAASHLAQGISGAVACDPAVIGASRFDLHTPDEAARARMKATYCADVSDEDFRAWAHGLVPDDPFAPLTQKIALTPARWGSLRRAYIKCTQDRVIPPALADDLIAAVDACTPGNRTVVRDIEASHSPFLSRPRELAAMIVDLALGQPPVALPARRTDR
jgi:pimeloyl-ACP methyl ester carboxylesterase